MERDCLFGSAPGADDLRDPRELEPEDVADGDQGQDDPGKDQPEARLADRPQPGEVGGRGCGREGGGHYVDDELEDLHQQAGHHESDEDLRRGRHVQSLDGDPLRLLDLTASLAERGQDRAEDERDSCEQEPLAEELNPLHPGSQVSRQDWVGDDLGGLDDGQDQPGHDGRSPSVHSALGERRPWMRSE